MATRKLYCGIGFRVSCHGVWLGVRGKQLYSQFKSGLTSKERVKLHLRRMVKPSVRKHDGGSLSLIDGSPTSATELLWRILI